MHTAHRMDSFSLRTGCDIRDGGGARDPAPQPLSMGHPVLGGRAGGTALGRGEAAAKHFSLHRLLKVTSKMG